MVHNFRIKSYKHLLIMIKDTKFLTKMVKRLTMSLSRKSSTSKNLTRVGGFLLVGYNYRKQIIHSCTMDTPCHEGVSYETGKIPL